jgi:shikimate kinase
MDQAQAPDFQGFIFIYGPPGSGKTIVGQRLAADLELPFTDLDAVIASQASLAIPDIFTAEGEAGFRRREQAALAATLSSAPGVVALGGGALLDVQNRRQAEQLAR